jgi:arylsulfatase G
MANGHHPNRRGFDSYVGLPYSNDMGCGAQPTDVMAPQNTERTSFCPACQSDGEPPPVCPADPSCGRSNGCYGMDMGVPLFFNETIVQQPASLDGLSDVYAQHTRSFIAHAAAAGEPFFLYYAAAHMHVPQNHADRWANRSTTPFATRANGGRAFAAALLEMDNEVGTVVAALEEYRLSERTLVFITGDNGPWECKCNLTGVSGPFSGHWQKGLGGGGSSSKCTLWEGGHRVVGLASWLGTIKPAVSEALSSAMDLLPTFAALAGVPLPTDREYDGVDLSPALLGGATGTTAVRQTLFHPSCKADPIGTSCPVTGALAAGRHGAYKFIWQSGGVPSCGGAISKCTAHEPPLIFHLDRDPAESTPLDPSSDPHAAAALAVVQKEREETLRRISSTPHSAVNWNTSAAGKSANCCNPENVACRCDDDYSSLIERFLVS